MLHPGKTEAAVRGTQDRFDRARADPGGIGLAPAGGDEGTSRGDVAQDPAALLLIPRVGDDPAGMGVNLEQLGGRCRPGGDGLEHQVKRQKPRALPEPVAAQRGRHRQREQAPCAQLIEVLLRERRGFIVFARPCGKLAPEPAGTFDKCAVLFGQTEVHGPPSPSDASCRCTVPCFMTNRTRCTARMSERGSPSTAITSARLPTSIDPALSARRQIAAFQLVAAWMASIGVYPPSTRFCISIARSPWFSSVPMPIRTPRSRACAVVRRYASIIARHRSRCVAVAPACRATTCAYPDVSTRNVPRRAISASTSSSSQAPCSMENAPASTRSRAAVPPWQ